MGAQQLAGLGVEDGLHQPFRLSHRDGLAVADEGEAAHPDLMAEFLRALLRQADAGHLRTAIGAAGDVQHIHRMRMLPRDGLHRDDRLMARLVGQPGRAGEVADGIDARLAGVAEGAGEHMRAVHLHLRALKAEILDIADDADGGDQAVGRDLLHLAIRLDDRSDAVRALADALHPRAGQQLHALLGEGLGDEAADLLILHRQDAVHHLDQRHLRAHVQVEAGEFGPDGAGADDDQRFRHRGRRHRFPIGPDQLAVGFHPWDHPRARAGRQDDVLRGEFGNRLAVLRHAKLAGAGELPVPVEDRNLVLLHQVLDPARKLARHLPAALDHFLEVEADIVGREAVLVERVQQMINLARAQQRLGRDAAPVEADAAQILPLHQRGLHAELAGADRRDIATGPAAHHDKIEALGHRQPPAARRRSASPVTRISVQPSRATAPMLR